MLTPLLFEPITIGGLRIKNRITMPPMHTNLGGHEEGITDSGADFYIARAKGGFGLMGIGIIDAWFVDGAGSPFEFFLENDTHVRNYARLVTELKRHGAVPYAQVGVRRLFPVKTMHRDNRPTVRDFTHETIEEMIEAVVTCAARAADAGFPAVDILGVGGSAHSIFLSQVFNNRTDQWGGSPDNRLRFATETVRRIKKRLGEDFPVFYRFHGAEFLKGGYGVEGAQYNAQKLEEAGVCYFNVTGGGHGTSVPQLTPNVPRETYAYLAREIREAVNSPVAASNRNSHPFEAERLLRKGWADMISLGRQSLADADWPNKVKAGAYDDIRYCVACNECLDITVIHDQPVVCLVNPRQGTISEVEDVKPAETRRRVVVVGAGVAGLQLALTSAERGHEVIVIEKKQHVGGMWHHAAAPPGREELFSFLEWLVARCHKAGVEFRLGTEADAEMLAGLKADVIAVSTGGKPVIPDIPGVDLPHVLPATAALEGNTEIGERVVIVGGGGIGVEVAPYLARRWQMRPEIMEFLGEYKALNDQDQKAVAKRGHQVIMTTRQDRIGGSVGGSTRWVLAKEVAHSGVKVMAGTTVQEITPEGVVVVQNGKAELLEADTVLLATGLAPDRSLYDRIAGSGIAAEVISVGDAEHAHHAIATLRDAYRKAITL